MVAQFDNIDRFYHQRVKVPKVICSERVQEFGDLTIPAPPGITFDVLSGRLNYPVSLELAGIPQIRTVTVFPNKIINQGIVPVRLLVDNLVSIQLLEVPFQGIVECQGANPGDLVQKHDVQIEGFSILPVQLLANEELVLHLIIKVVLELCVIVTEETILKVNAMEPFCK